MEPKWQSIETAPTDFTVFMVAWPHSQMDGGWFFDFWAGKHLLDVRKAYDEGLDKLSPHMWQMPTHWQPLPVAPDATNTHPPATDVAALVGVLAKGGFMMTETHNIGEHRARKLVIGFQNGRDADLAMEAVAIAIKAYRDAT